MQTNQVKDTCNGVPFFGKITGWKYAPFQVFSKVLLRPIAIYNEFLGILGTFISQNTSW